MASPLVSLLPFALPEAIEAALRAQYATPPRAYHNFRHVEEVLGHFARVPDWQDPVSVALAILFHDAIYEAGRPDNEARSAKLAAEMLAGTALEARVPRVQELVTLTARHGQPLPVDVDHDAARFLDCDMAILGAAPDEYDRYERAIALEYAHVPADLYRAGRAHFLTRLLESPRIYLSDRFRAEREASARANLRRALEALLAK
jgi:predicted metal-dependent HD superfamily phosphohydrolase